MQQPPNQGWQAYNQPPQGSYPQQQPMQTQPPQFQPYQQPMSQPPPPKKKSRLPLILAIVAGVLVLSCIGVFALINAAAKNAGSVNTGTVATNTSNSTQIPTNQHFKVGQAVNVGDTWQVTINSAKTNAGSGFNKPQHAGDVFLIFSITVKNVSDKEQTISSALNFNLQDSTGQKYDETIDTDAGASLDGKVEANGLSKGVIVYEVPKNVKAFQLAFESDIISGGQTIWDITV